MLRAGGPRPGQMQPTILLYKQNVIGTQPHLFVSYCLWLLSPTVLSGVVITEAMWRQNLNYLPLALKRRSLLTPFLEELVHNTDRCQERRRQSGWLWASVRELMSGWSCKGLVTGWERRRARIQWEKQCAQRCKDYFGAASWGCGRSRVKKNISPLEGLRMSRCCGHSLCNAHNRP